MTFSLESRCWSAQRSASSLCFLFVDCEKTFDTAELSTVLRVLVEEAIDENFEMVKEANRGCSTDIPLFAKLVRMEIEKGERRSDSLSPLPVSSWYRKLNMESNGELLNRFASWMM